MCADPLKLNKELEDLSNSGIDWLHCDVMDGVFVDNLAMAPYGLQPIIQSKKFITDIHLACINPEKYIKMFAKIKPDYITFHIEVAPSPSNLIELIKNFGIKAGIAVSPQTRIESIYPYLDTIDLILVMTVNPGFAGQKFQYHVLDKLKKLNSHLSNLENKPLIQVDGNIYSETAKEISQFGADLYVVGTSALFNESELSYQEKIKIMEDSI